MEAADAGGLKVFYPVDLGHVVWSLHLIGIADIMVAACCVWPKKRKEKTTPHGAWITGGAVRLGPKTVRPPLQCVWPHCSVAQMMVVMVLLWNLIRSCYCSTVRYISIPYIKSREYVQLHGEH